MTFYQKSLSSRATSISIVSFILAVFTVPACVGHALQIDNATLSGIPSGTQSTAQGTTLSMSARMNAIPAGVIQVQNPENQPPTPPTGGPTGGGSVGTITNGINGGTGGNNSGGTDSSGSNTSGSSDTQNTETTTTQSTITEQQTPSTTQSNSETNTTETYNLTQTPEASNVKETQPNNEVEPVLSSAPIQYLPKSVQNKIETFLFTSSFETEVLETQPTNTAIKSQEKTQKEETLIATAENTYSCTCCEQTKALLLKFSDAWIQGHPLLWLILILQMFILVKVFFPKPKKTKKRKTKRKEE